MNATHRIYSTDTGALLATCPSSIACDVIVDALREVGVAVTISINAK